MREAAADLSLVLAASARVFREASDPAHVGLVDPAVADLARATAIDASAGWLQLHRTMRLATTGAGVDLDRAAASRMLQAAVGDRFFSAHELDPKSGARQRPPERLPELLADVRLLVRGAAESAAVLRHSVERTARQESFYLPARLAAAVAPRPIPMEWVSAGRRSGWVRASATLPLVLDIRDSVDQAHDVTQAAALLGARTARIHQVGAGTAGHSACYGQPPRPYRTSLQPCERNGVSHPRDAGPPAI